MEKNFLETISNDYPSSFAEEKFIHSEKNYKKLIFGIVLAILIIILAIFILFKLNKKVTMKNFIGEPKEVLNIWLKENGISNKNVIITYEYDLEYDENIIIDQNVLEGEKISKNKVLNFVLSKGADPDELIKFPKIKEMTYDDIKTWINDNKLTNVKVNQEYNEEIEKDMVISYKLKNIAEDEFTRSSNLVISVSKGVKPKNEITMENFVGKSSDTLAAWAMQNKIEINSNLIFSNKESGEIIYQSIPAGEKVSEGDKISVNISKGPGVVIPYFIGKKKINADTWSSANNIIVAYNEIYSNYERNTIIDQSIQANSQIGTGDTLIITVSLGKPYLNSYIGENINELYAWLEDVNTKGANINLVINDKKYYSETVNKDGIINQNKSGYLELNDTVNITLSLGAKVLIDTDYIGTSENDIKLFCTDLNCIYEYQKSNQPIGTVIDIKVNNKTLKPNTYINNADVILITISEGA